MSTLAASRPADGVEQVTGYTGLETAGRGRVSVVYRATQEREQRTVALKVFLLDRPDNAALRRFRRGCQLTSRLSGHPHVVTALDVGTTHSGHPYMATEYFEHGSLGDRLASGGPLSVEEALRAGVEIADALAAAHAIGILHRDVRPPNVLVRGDGVHALADFDVAVLTGGRDGGSQRFAPSHTAPEVLRGQPPSVASDIYSLGATLYELLTGSPPHDDAATDGTEALPQRIASGPPEVSRQDAPAPLVALIEQAVTNRVDERVPDAFTFAERLRQVQSELGMATTRPSQAGQVQRPRLAVEPAPPDEPAPAAEPSSSGGRRRWTQRIPIGPVTPAAERSLRVRGQTTPPGGPHDVSGSGTSRSGAVPLIAGILVLMLLGWGVELGLRSALDALLGPPSGAGTHAATATPPPTAAVPASQIDGARPTGVVAAASGPSVVLHWQLQPGNRYPLFVRRTASAGGAPTLTAVPNGSTTTTVAGIDPHADYCFQVGAVVLFGNPSTVAWSAPACIPAATP